MSQPEKKRKDGNNSVSELEQDLERKQNENKKLNVENKKLNVKNKKLTVENKKLNVDNKALTVKNQSLNILADENRKLYAENKFFYQNNLVLSRLLTERITESKLIIVVVKLKILSVSALYLIKIYIFHFCRTRYLFKL